MTKNDTLIIVDWDDTLFPTSWSVKNNINLNDMEVRNRYLVYFSELDRILYKLLNKLLDYGDVSIVTNALPKWITISSDVLPNTKYLLKRIKIISARQLYQPTHPQMMDWKKEVFKSEISAEVVKKEYLNIISIGDAEYEYNALIELNKTNTNKKILKAVKLMGTPTHETLLDQLEVLTKAAPNLCLSNYHLDLQFKFFSGFAY